MDTRVAFGGRFGQKGEASARAAEPEESSIVDSEEIAPQRRHQRQRIVRVDESFQKREQGRDLARIRERATAGDVVGNAARFEGPGVEAQVPPIPQQNHEIAWCESSGGGKRLSKILLEGQ